MNKLKIWTDQEVSFSYLQHTKDNEPKTFISTDDAGEIVDKIDSMVKEFNVGSVGKCHEYINYIIDTKDQLKKSFEPVKAEGGGNA